MAVPTYIPAPIEVTGTSNYAISNNYAKGWETTVTDFSQLFAYKYDTATDWSINLEFRASRSPENMILMFNGQSVSSTTPIGSEVYDKLNSNAIPTTGWDGWCLYVDSNNHPAIIFSKNGLHTGSYINGHAKNGVGFTSDAHASNDTHHSYTKGEVGWNDKITFSDFTLESGVDYTIEIKCTSAGNFKCTCNNVSKTAHFSKSGNYDSACGTENGHKLSRGSILNTGVFGLEKESKFVVGTNDIFVKSFALSGTKSGGQGTGDSASKSKFNGRTDSTDDYRGAGLVTDKNTCSFSVDSYADLQRANISIFGKDHSYSSGWTVTTTGGGSVARYVANFRASMVKVDRNNNTASFKTGSENNYYKQYESSADLNYRYFLNDGLNDETMVWPVLTATNGKKLKGFGDTASSTTVHADGIKARNANILGSSLGAETTEFAIWGNVVFIPNVDQEYTYNADSQGIGAPNTEAKARQYCNGCDETKYNLPTTGDGGYCTITTSKFTNAGTYTITFNLKSGSGAVWSDGTTSAKTVSLVINKKPLTLPKFNTEVFYNGAKYKTTVTYTNSSDGMSNRILGSDVLKVTYTTKGSDAGTYEQEDGQITVLVNVSNNYEWSYPSDKATIIIKKRTLTITTKGHTWVYDNTYHYWRGDGEDYFTYDEYGVEGFVSGDPGTGCAYGSEIHTTTDYETYWTGNILGVNANGNDNTATENAFREKLASGKYKDITVNYNVTFGTPGKLKNTKRPVKLTTGSGIFNNDSTAHSVETIEASAIAGNPDSGLCTSHTLSYSTATFPSATTSTIPNELTSANKSKVKIMQGSTDRTSWYDITWDWGTITILTAAIVFTVTIDKAEAQSLSAQHSGGGVLKNNTKEYDGNTLFGYPLYYSGTWKNDADQPYIANNKRVSVSGDLGIGGTVYLSESDVQTLCNAKQIRIDRGSTQNVNSDYGGNSKVLWVATPMAIVPRKITIENKPETKVYDGTNLVHSYSDSNTDNIYVSSGSLCTPIGDTLAHKLTIGDISRGPNVGLWPAETTKPKDGVIEGSKSVEEWQTPIDITANYEITYKGGDMEITKRPITYTVSDATKEYDGTPLVATVALTSGSLVTGQTAVISEVSIGPDVGSASDCVPDSVIIRGSGQKPLNSNYDITLVGGDLSITKKSITITNASESKTYDGTPLVHSVENGKITASGLLAGHTFAVNDLSYGPDFGAASMAPANAIIYDSEGTPVTGNYNITYVAGTMEITKANVTISNTTETKEYDGTELEHTVANGKVTHDAVPDGCTVEALAKFGPAVGTSNVNVTYDIKKNGVSVLSNFVVTTAPAQMAITSRAITIKNKDGAKSYDGEALVHHYYNNNTGEIYISSGSLAPGQSMTVPAISVGPAAGTYTGTPAGAVIRDEEGNDITSNYNPTYVAGTMTISENALVITVAGSTKVYDGTVLSVTPTYTGSLNEGDTITFHPVEKGPDVGTWNSTVAEWPTHYEIKDSEGNDHHNNYTIQTVGGNLSITKKPLTPVWSTPLTKVYDGTILSISAVPNPAELVAAGDVTAFTVDTDHVGPNVTAATGTYTSKVTGLVGPKASNYDIPASAADRTSGWYSITQKPLTVTNATGTKVYDGSPLVHSTDNGKITATGLLSGHTMTVSSISKGKDVGTWTAAQCTPSGAVIKEGTTDVTANYAITYVGNQMSITPRTATLSWSTPDSQGYDGTALPITCTVSNAVSGDTVTVTYSPTSAGPNIGSYTATATALAGASAGNYALPSSGLTHTYTITSGTGVPVPYITPTDYNLTGGVINATIYNYPNAKIQLLSGTLSASEPGEYTATFHLIDPNDCWDDATSSKADIKLTWRIIGYKIHVWKADNAWHDYMPYYWDGTQWRLTKPYYWNGTQWVLCGR